MSAAARGCPSPQRRALLGAALGGPLLALSGCVSIPTHGDVERADARPRRPDPSVEVAPQPPTAGASPLSVVTGFLQAMGYYQRDYAVARQYLTSAAQAQWQPEAGVSIYANNYFPSATEKNATLTAPLTGRLLGDSSYRPAGKQLSIDFGMVKQKGEWRIGKPPQGLLISQYDFDQFYHSFDLYFFEPHMSSLVPDPIYLPNGNQSATTLLTRLLQGPTDWLRPGVVSAIPAKTTLSVAAPVDPNGVVDVSLSDAVADLGDQQRSLVAAQFTWTLRQLSGVTGVRFSVNGAHWSVRRDEVNQVVPISALALDGPIAPQVSTQLVGATRDGVVKIDDTGGHLDPVSGPWAKTRNVSSLALTAEGATVAAVVGASLLVGPLADQQLKTFVSGERLLRPQYSRFGELWVVDSRTAGPSRFWRVVDDSVSTVATNGLGGGRVLAFRLSPDGLRLAVLQRRGSSIQLGIVLVNRSGTAPVLESWRTVGVYQSQGNALPVLSDVAWLDATSLMVLAAPDDNTQPSPYILTQDGSSSSSAGNPDQWNATMLAASPHEPPTVKVVLVGQNSQVWRYEDDYTWAKIATGVTTVAYAG